MDRARAFSPSTIPHCFTESHKGCLARLASVGETRVFTFHDLIKHKSLLRRIEHKKSEKWLVKDTRNHRIGAGTVCFSLSGRNYASNSVLVSRVFIRALFRLVCVSGSAFCMLPAFVSSSGSSQLCTVDGPVGWDSECFLRH